MRNAVEIGRVLAVGTALLTSCVGLSDVSQAKVVHHVGSHRVTQGSTHRAASAYARRDHRSARALVHLASLHRNAKYAFRKGSKGRHVRYGAYYGGLQCVPFARAASGIELKGNAANWWDAAAGIYQRGARPEPGSVLNFRANGHMRLGHVAVVTAVMDSREISIEHANWAGPGANKGGVARNIPVEDVSPDNDWSEVRVGLGQSGGWGSVYSTYGFIYDRPDSGAMLANGGGPASNNLASADAYTEVAQAPARALRPTQARLLLDAPSRDLQ